MLLVMDAGNTHTVLGLYRDDVLAAHWRIVTSGQRAADELRALFSTLFQQAGFDLKAVTGCCISSVAPAVNDALEEVCQTALGVAPLFVGPGVRTGLVLQVENPKEVGADRIVNAVAALEAYGGPVIIVDFGTATTFDAVTERAEYRGGVIVPGIQIAADALFEKCAKLPRVEIVRPAGVIGKDTISHIRAGLTYGYADLVDGLIRRISEEMGSSPKVIATGGFAGLIAEIATRIDHVDPRLTLDGLRIIFGRNARAAK